MVLWTILANFAFFLKFLQINLSIEETLEEKIQIKFLFGVGVKMTVRLFDGLGDWGFVKSL